MFRKRYLTFPEQMLRLQNHKDVNTDTVRTCKNLLSIAAFSQTESSRFPRLTAPDFSVFRALPLPALRAPSLPLGRSCVFSSDGFTKGLGPRGQWLGR